MTSSSWPAGRSPSPTPRRSKAGPPACQTDRIDAWGPAELCRRDLVPEIWLPTPGAGRAGTARFRLHLVRHQTAHNRLHATLLAFGKPCPVSDLFGAGVGSCWAPGAAEPGIDNVTAAMD